MQELPTVGYLRLSQIIGDRKAQPPVPPIIPVSKSTWWAGVKTGRFPKPIKLGPNVTAWRCVDIRELLERLDAQAEARERAGSHPNPATSLVRARRRSTTSG
jgi:prophage regulatory protein